MALSYTDLQDILGNLSAEEQRQLCYITTNKTKTKRLGYLFAMHSVNFNHFKLR